MMLTAGESLAWLANQVGQSDWGMLRTIYAKLIKDSIPDAGNKAAKMFSVSSNKKCQPYTKKTGIKAGITTLKYPKSWH